MRRTLLMFATALIASAVPAMAQSYEEESIETAGSAAALAVVCQKLTPAQAAKHKAEIMRMDVGKKVTAAQFESWYGRGYNDVIARARKLTAAQLAESCKPRPAVKAGG